MTENLGLAASAALDGAGMFAESYFLFAIGNISPVWEEGFPECFDAENVSCNTVLIKSFPYVEVFGVVLGMLVFGVAADVIGRRAGSTSTANIMFVGALVTTAASGKNVNGQFLMFGAGLVVFGIGVGGEYPLASSSAAEKAETAKARGDYKRSVRGKAMAFTFCMQGWGSFVNTAVILVTLSTTNCTGELCSDFNWNRVWRVQYAVGAVFVAYLLLGRFAFLKESEVWEENHARNKPHPRTTHHNLLLKHFWHRLLGTASSWYLSDIVFYGNKLFPASIIIAVIGGNPTVFQVIESTLLNNFVALIGYYSSAFLMDKPWMGRRRLQQTGFFFSLCLFGICGIAFDELVKTQNVRWFQALYFMSSFFVQFTNSTTWLLAAECFPTSVRSTAHGISAAIGKLGALTATLLFSFGGGNGSPMSTQAFSLFVLDADCVDSFSPSFSFQI